MEQEPQVSPLQIPDVKLPEQLDHSVSTITNSESNTYEAHLTHSYTHLANIHSVKHNSNS